MVNVAPKGGIRKSPIRKSSRHARTPNIDKTHKYSATLKLDLVPQQRTIRKETLRIDYSIQATRAAMVEGEKLLAR